MGLLYKLAYLAQTKADIKEALQDKGQDVTDSDTFRSYADFVSEISGGSAGGAIRIMYHGSTGVGGAAEILEGV